MFYFCVHIVFLSERQHLFSVVSNEQRSSHLEKMHYLYRLFSEPSLCSKSKSIISQLFRKALVGMGLVTRLPGNQENGGEVSTGYVSISRAFKQKLSGITVTGMSICES